VSDLKKMNMSELIALHNQLADNLGVAQELEFKSMAAARAAVTTLQNKASTVMNTETTQESQVAAEGTATPADAEKSAKYSTVGKRGPNQGIGAFAKEQIAAGKTNAEIMEMVKTQFPTAKTTPSCIAFYRNAIKKGDTKAVKSPEELRAAAQALLDQAAAAEAAAVAKAAEAEAVPA
jgi:hypothetical protein